MKIKIGLGQINPSARSPEDNLLWAIEKADEAARLGAKLLLLPELFPFGLLENEVLAQKRGRDAKEMVSRLKKVAEEKCITICAGLPFQAESKEVFNSLFIISPDGNLLRYDKLHLFPPFEEPRIFSPGKSPLEAWLDHDNGELGIGPMICYDIRFPELARHYSAIGCRLLIVSALWPKSRRDNFVTLLRTRAMENQCFTAAANACGTCSDIEFAGASLLAGPDGSIMHISGEDEGLHVVEANLDRIKKARSFFNSAWPQNSWAFSPKNKIYQLDDLKKIARRRKEAGQRLVFTNGCFDVIHAGHVSYLKKARTLGDFLVVGLNSDGSIKRIKGASRPINNQEHRATVLAALSFVDYVVIFHEDTPENLIRELEPDILVKGADWKEDEIVGASFVKSIGGRVERIPFEIDISTTKIIEKAKEK